jgi:hypothetical protein
MLQRFEVTTNERFFLCAAPFLTPALALNGIDNAPPRSEHFA